MPNVKKTIIGNLITGNALSATGIMVGSNLPRCSFEEKASSSSPVALSSDFSYDIMQEVWKYERIDSHADIWNLHNGDPKIQIDHANRVGIRNLFNYYPVVGGEATPIRFRENKMLLFWYELILKLRVFFFYSWRLLILSMLLISCQHSGPEGDVTQDFSGWKTYAGTKEGNRYSSNEEINKTNVAELEIAWRYSTNDKDPNDRSQIQTNPIVVEGVLYGISPRAKLFALDAVTGEEKWLFDPAVLNTKKDPGAFFKVSRGIVYREDENGGGKRIFHAVGEKLYAIDAETGQPVEEFGKKGFIDFSENLGRDNDQSNSFVAATTPGVLYKDILIMGSRLSESADAPPGHIRAYNANNGELEWIFHTIPQPGEPGYESWPDKNAWKKSGGANSWAGMALDEQRGIIYIPTGSVSGDFYGGTREGSNLFGNSLIALKAATGEYLWHYQIVHHDLWDRDLAANPNLVTLYKNKDTIDAVAQITKHGYVFLFDRLTGEPVFPIEEVPVPQNALPGEHPWPTQPIPRLPEPFARQNFSRKDVSDIDPETHSELLKEFDKIKHKAMFTPPSKDGSWIFPGFDGGGQWGGAAVDPESQILYVNSSELPWSLTMVDVPRKQKPSATLKGKGRGIYNEFCIACHGKDLQGNGSSYPALTNLTDKYAKQNILAIIKNGRNMMPSFNNFSTEETDALMVYILDLEDEKIVKDHIGQKEPGTDNILDGIPYRMTGYNRFLDKNGYPGIKPPWGTLNAIDLNSGERLWKVPLGEYSELMEKGIPPTGTENYGGPVVTKGGLVFIAATKDSKIRAFDKETGEVLWEASLSAPGYATPATYMIDGKQYLVIACGGGKIGSKSGDEYIAFALPENE